MTTQQPKYRVFHELADGAKSAFADCYSDAELRGVLDMGMYRRELKLSYEKFEEPTTQGAGHARDWRLAV